MLETIGIIVLAGLSLWGIALLVYDIMNDLET